MWRVAFICQIENLPHLVVSVNLGACTADFGAVFIGLTLVMMEMQFFGTRE